MKEKIKVCHVVSKLDVGGMENGIINICNGINRSLFLPYVLCMKDTGPMMARLKPEVKVHNLGFKEGKSPFRPFSMAKYFKKEKPDVVHTHGWGGCSFDAIIGARLAGVPVVINGEHGSFFTKPYQIYAQRFLSVLCNNTLSVSESLKKMIVQNIGIKPDRIISIENGVNTDLFNGKKNIDSLINELRNKYMLSFNDNTFFAGCIGSLKPVKNQIFLLKAFKQLRAKHPDIDIVLLFAGVGQDREMLEKYSVESGIKDRVVFLGQRNDIPELLSLMDILALTSLPDKEGMSNVILEAMSSGVPVLSTPSIGSSELIRHGVNGFVVNDNDTDDICDKLLILSQNKNMLASFSNEAAKFIMQNYSLNKMMLSYEHIYMKYFEE